MIEAFPSVEINSALISKEFDSYQFTTRITYNGGSVETFCIDLYFKSQKGEVPYLTLCKYALQLLLLPHSNAVTERVFSLVNATKTKRRNKMSIETLESLIMVKQHHSGAIDIIKSYPALIKEDRLREMLEKKNYLLMTILNRIKNKSLH